MILTTIEELTVFLRHVMAKAKHHASAAQSIIPPLLMGVLLYADSGTLRTTSGIVNPTGIQIRFHFRGVPFKLKHVGSGFVALHQVIGTSESAAIATFAPHDPVQFIPEQLHVALMRTALAHAAA